tara:strand:- start:1450 stop:2304 length:855 start_codon:yes stop_codon:yes gene_type:complete
MATVKLQDREIKKLKITVTNIKSVLLEKNKELKQVKLSKKRLANAALQLERKEAKEKSVEAVKKSSPLTSFSKKAGAATGNIIDKILSFGSIILGGILVNALPGFIKKFNEIWESIKPFIDGVGSAIKNIANFFGGITESVKNFFGITDKTKTDDLAKGQKELEGELKGLEKESDIDVNSLSIEDESVEVDDEGNVIGGEDVMSDTDIPAEETSDTTQSESDSTADISKMIDSVPSKGGGVKPNQAQFKRINNNQDLVKLNQRTSTGPKTVIVQRQVVEVPVPV